MRILWLLSLLFAGASAFGTCDDVCPISFPVVSSVLLDAAFWLILREEKTVMMLFLLARSFIVTVPRKEEHVKLTSSTVVDLVDVWVQLRK